MNSAGRRIAALAATLVFAASTLGLILSVSYAEEFDPPAEEGTGTSVPTPDSTSTKTQPANPQTTFENDTTGSTPATSELPDFTGSDPLTDTDQPITQTTPDTQTPTDPPSTTFTQPAITTDAPATKAPSHDPYISAGAFTSEPSIPLSTQPGDGQGNADQSQEGKPGNDVGAPGQTAQTERPAKNPFADLSANSASNGRAITRISVVCSIFAVLSGAVLVLLKFIR